MGLRDLFALLCMYIGGLLLEGYEYHAKTLDAIYYNDFTASSAEKFQVGRMM